MSISYKAVPRKNPRSPEDPAKYYPAPVSRGTVKINEIAEQIARESTLGKAEIKAMLETLCEVSASFLAKGMTVRLGDFGIFSLSLKGSGTETPGELTADNIIRARVQYRPGKLMLNTLGDLSYEKKEQ